MGPSHGIVHRAGVQEMLNTHICISLYSRPGNRVRKAESMKGSEALSLVLYGSGSKSINVSW